MVATRRRAVVDGGPPLVRLSVVEALGADDDVGVAICIHVPGRGDRPTEEGLSWSLSSALSPVDSHGSTVIGSIASPASNATDCPAAARGE